MWRIAARAKSSRTPTAASAPHRSRRRFMALLENGALRADPYLRVAEEDALPDGAPALLTLARLLREAPLRNAPTGVELPPDANPLDLAPVLDRLALIALR